MFKEYIYLSLAKFIELIKAALSSICAGASIVESVQNIESHRAASLSADYHSPLDKNCPYILLKNNGEHHASNVRISSKPALNFSPYEGKNLYVIPKLAAGDAAKVYFFPTFDSDLKSLGLTVKYFDGHHQEKTEYLTVII